MKTGARAVSPDNGISGCNHVTPQAVHYSSDIRTLIAPGRRPVQVSLPPGEAGDPVGIRMSRLP